VERIVHKHETDRFLDDHFCSRCEWGANVMIYILLLVLAGCATKTPIYYEAPSGLNDYAQQQDYLDCHASWQERACFLERGYRESGRPAVSRTLPTPSAIAHSHP